MSEMLEMNWAMSPAEVAEEEAWANAPDGTAGCGMCGGPGVPLGKLGCTMWWRCRNCGAQWPTEGVCE